MAFKHETFDTPNDLIIRSKQLLREIYERKNLVARDFGEINDQSFLYLYEKFDAVYHQERLLLQSTFLEKGEDQNSILQRQTKSKKRLTDLIRCELLIHQTIQRSFYEIPSCLVSLLEVLFEDYENLDLLLLLIFRKMFGEYKDKGDFYAKITYFMLPFLRLFGREGFDFLKTWENRKDSTDILELISALVEEIKISLHNQTQLSEKEVNTFVEGLNGNSQSSFPIRIDIRKICEKKEAFKDEKLYYKMLGSLSLLQYLYCTREDNEEKALAFLRIGIIVHIFNGKFFPN